MVLGRKGIFTTECSTDPCQGVSGEEAKKDHGQSGCITRQVEGNQVGYPQ